MTRITDIDGDSMKDFEKHLKHRIKRLRERAKDNEEQYFGKEDQFTFHGGYYCGYVDGKLSVLEDIAFEIYVDEVRPIPQETIHKMQDIREKLDQAKDRLSENNLK